MTNTEILKVVLEKAINKGYKPVENLGNALFDATCDMLIIKDLYRAIIFSHDFAKAFWGERETQFSFPITVINESWEYHLQQMVLEREPLKYLEKFL